MHVSDLSLKLGRTRGGRVPARITATVVDGSAQPVPSATVTGAWSLNAAPAGQSTAQTDQKGAAVAKKTIKGVKSGDTIRLCVTNIAKAGYTYDPSSNKMTCAEAKVP
jgi:hypothetical protein